MWWGRTVLCWGRPWESPQILCELLWATPECIQSHLYGTKREWWVWWISTDCCFTSKAKQMQVSIFTGNRHRTCRSLPYSPSHSCGQAPCSTAHSDPSNTLGNSTYPISSFYLLFLFLLKKKQYIIVTSILLRMATEPLHSQKPGPNQTEIGTCDETFKMSWTQITVSKFTPTSGWPRRSVS